METQNTAMTTAQLAERLGVTPQCLRRWRMRGLGPAYFKFGDPVSGGVRYRESEVIAWEQSRITRTRETPADA